MSWFSCKGVCWMHELLACFSGFLLHLPSAGQPTGGITTSTLRLASKFSLIKFIKWDSSKIEQIQ